MTIQRIARFEQAHRQVAVLTRDERRVPSVDRFNGRTSMHDEGGYIGGRHGRKSAELTAALTER